ncbi:MAG: helix-turn-helix transcriptional regulator [Pirellulaceae bacterium]
MMSTSPLSIDEIRQVFWLLGECTELGADPIVWRQHLARGSATLVREHFVNVVETTVIRSEDGSPKPVTLGYFNGGDLINAKFELIHQFMEAPEQINPMIPRMLSPDNPASTHLRQEFVQDDDWYRSHFYQEYLRPLGLNDQVTSIDLTAPHSASAICWLSYPRETCPSRAAIILQFLQTELTRLKRMGKLAPIGGFSLTHLTSRQLQILYGLFQGDSEKQLALRLGISQHTVHDHLKRLHARMGASSRGELLAACLKFWPALESLQETP